MLADVERQPARQDREVSRPGTELVVVVVVVMITAAVVGEEASVALAPDPLALPPAPRPHFAAVCFRVGQKHEEVLDAFDRRFPGGSMYHDKERDFLTWSIQAGAQEAMEELAPCVIGKRAQFQMVYAWNAGLLGAHGVTSEQYKKAVDDSKGNCASRL